MIRIVGLCLQPALVFSSVVSLVVEDAQIDSEKLGRIKSEVINRISQQYPTAVSVSSDGAQVLLRISKWDSDELLVVNTRSGRTVAKTEAKDTQLAVSWSPDGSRIAYLLAPGNGNAYRLHVWTLSEQLVRQIDAPITNVAVQPPRWSPDSTQLAYMVGSFEESAIWIVDLAQRTAPRILAEHARPKTDFEWSPDGKEMAFALRESPSTLRVVSTTTGELIARVQLGTEKNSEIRDLWWAPSGKSLAVTGRGSGNYVDLFTVKLPSGQIHPCVSIGASVASPRFAPDGQTIVFLVLKNAEQLLYSTSCDDSGPRLLGFDSGTTRFLRFLKHGSARSGSTPAFGALHTATDEPSALYAIPLGSGKAELIYRPPHSEQLKSPPPKEIQIFSEQFGAFPATLWETASDSRDPAITVVDVHGGPHLQSSVRWEFLASLLSRSGASALSPNYLGSSGYGYRYEESGTTTERVKQIVAACKFAKTLGGRSNRVVLIGTSYGSLLAAAAAVADPQDVDGLILISLVGIDFSHASLRHPSFPIYCFHGENDPLPPERARRVVESFFGSDTAFGWQTVPGEGHVFRHVGPLASIYSAVLDMTSSRDRKDQSKSP